jgi:hypothetical protein
MAQLYLKVYYFLNAFERDKIVVPRQRVCVTSQPKREQADDK